jgi:class 3 adenylate cyclase
MIESIRRALTVRKISFQLCISVLFTALIVPVLFVILSYSYEKNSRNLIAMSDSSIDRARDDSISIAANLLDPVISTLRLTAEVAATNPDYFRTEESRNFLYQALTSADQIDAIYTSFEDGYHRVVTRVDADRRRSDPRIPAAANWHASYVDAFSAGRPRLRHRSFFATWPTVIARYDQPTTIDIRILPHYVAAKATGALAIADPSINPDTGYPVMSLGYPIISGGRFIGFVGANMTFTLLSEFLASHKVSPHSTTLILDKSGRIIAHSTPSHGVHEVDGKLVAARIADLADPAIVKAAAIRAATKSDHVRFTLPSTGMEYVALFSAFPADFRKPWEVLIVVPLDDFIGDLKRTNRDLALLILSLIAVEAALIFFVAKRISRPIQAVAHDVQVIQSLQFGMRDPPRSRIREIFQLENAVGLMSNSLRSFSAFVPLGIVQQLIDSGSPLTLSGESRFLTIFFSDLEDFSAVSEKIPPADLMRQVSSYFEEVTHAVAAESGTIDKFIGDSVMAFWNAPTAIDDHVYRACRAAVRAAARLKALNDRWRQEGRPQMRIRIGVNCADVVVGNVGSSDRLSYTAMGDGVNVASRLEGLNKVFGTTICISDSVYDAVSDRIVARPLRPVSVKGRQSRFMVYELLGIRDALDAELRAGDGAIELCAMTAAAMTALTSGRIAEATMRYDAIVDRFPGDAVARLVRDSLAERADTHA